MIKPKHLFLAGSGSGGHMSPIVPIAQELIARGHKVTLVTDRGSQFVDVFTAIEGVQVRQLSCGKYRRYPGMDLKLRNKIEKNLLNIRDVFLTLVGLIEGLWLLIRYRPSALFLKGGAISVPLGLAARVTRIPFMTHDSDTIPGLSNQIAGRWARYNLVNGPPQSYKYDPRRTIQIGVPLRRQFLEAKSMQSNSTNDVLFVGGSQGSVAINHTAIHVAQENPNLQIVNICGRGNAPKSGALGSNLKNLQVFEYVDNPLPLMVDCKIVVARSSATFVAELAALKKSCIFVPHPGLSDQKSNASLISQKEAGVVIEQDGDVEFNVDKACSQILSDQNYAEFLAKNLHELFASEDAVMRVVDLLENINKNVGDSGTETA